MEKTELIDTHAHLDDKRFDADRDAVMARAQAAGVGRIITVGCWHKTRGFGHPAAVADHYPNVSLALGVHPHEAKDVADSSPYDAIRTLAADVRRKVVAVGETGLDYHYDHSPREVQKKIFASQIALARELNLPLIIHSREADADTLDMMEAEGAKNTGGVFHCFSGGPEMARRALDMGFYLSFTGVVTFPNAGKLREVVKSVPIEKMLVETDCPYLAPAAERGKRNEPAFVVHTARELASLKGLSLEDVARITTLNAEDLFGLGKKKGDPMIAYAIRNSLYLNVTNRCTNYCSFCAKFKSYTVKGHYLRLKEEPTVARILEAVGPDPLKYSEIVFCGYGEPLLRLDVVKEVGMHFKRMGCKIRIDTDGLANLANRKNVLPELMFVDVISVSLNAPDSDTYLKLIKSPFGEAAFPAILFFLREAKRYIPKVVASVVAVPGLDIEACRKLAVDDLGVEFRVREYDNVG